MKTPEDALLCPITLEIFRDPVVAQDGHTYERKAIEEWIRKYGTSPITSKQISLEHIVPNYAIKKVINHFETSLRDKNFQYTLDVDVKKKKGRPLFQTFGKTIYHAEWLPTNNDRPEVILLKIDGARANKEASFYVDLSRHTHIVRTFGLVREDEDDRNSIMLLQEYASEGSLYELLTERKKALEEKILIEIFLQIIEAMSYLALNNVVHGDLACRNVLVFRFDEKNPRNIVVKITDFGLSRYSKIYSQTATVARTALNIVPTRYCAPEILSTNVTADDYTEKSDVYSTGVLMWEAYSRGAIPWTTIENDDEVVRQVKNGNILLQPANCSSQYWNIITKTWAILPNQRPTFDQLKQLFKEQINQTITSAPKPSASSYKPASDTVASLDQGLSDSQSSPKYLPSSSSAETSRPNNKPKKTDKMPPYYHTNNQTPSPQPSSLVTTGGTGVREEKDTIDLQNQSIQIDKQKIFVRGRIVCGNEELYAVESDKSLEGYDGRCPKCRRAHVQFYEPNKGYYASVKKIHDMVYKEKITH